MDDPAGRDRGREHLAGGVTTGITQDDGDGTPKDDIDSPPQLSTVGVVRNVPLELVAIREDLTRCRSAESQHLRGSPGRLLTFAVLGHPSSLRSDQSTNFASTA
jgi:hypothetical protein